MILTCETTWIEPITENDSAPEDYESTILPVKTKSALKRGSFR